jgi:hypothetical protein
MLQVSATTTAATLTVLFSYTILPGWIGHDVGSVRVTDAFQPCLELSNTTKLELLAGMTLRTFKYRKKIRAGSFGTATFCKKKEILNHLGRTSPTHFRTHPSQNHHLLFLFCSVAMAHSETDNAKE